MGHRHARLEALAFEIVQSLLLEARDPRLEDVELTALELSPDGRNLLLLYVHPEREAAEAAFARAAPFFSAGLADRLGTKRVPEVRARFDVDVSDARRAVALLESAPRQEETCASSARPSPPAPEGEVGS